MGKSTFAYHLINYLLSRNENNTYDVNKFKINAENLSYKLLSEKTHPNFFLVENTFLENDIKIEQIRNLLNFLNKTTYKNDLKIVMIDNAELLNLNSSNALLKSIEEPSDNVLFFIIHNNPIKILDTIKSRCTEFKFFLSISEKKFIFNNIAKDYKINSKLENYTESLSFNTPGSLLKYALFTQEVDEEDLNSIDFFIDKYNDQKNPEFLFFLSLIIEKFYLNLCKSKKGNLNQIFLNYSRILNQINSIKKFNLSEKNIFISIKNKIINETR